MRSSYLRLNRTEADKPGSCHGLSGSLCVCGFMLPDLCGRTEVSPSKDYQVDRTIKTNCVVDWCTEKVSSDDALITRRGKNWYVQADHCIITVNAHSYTIITAHRER
ncbi:DUF3781 domain-containing protein [Faecalicatena contorta]|uniref:DUF3781 domain-containing protein n=1 Tax=Faecalicatena contorta TaxID=39482 RepID=UPI002ED4D408